jgi:hypothetical protein
MNPIHAGNKHNHSAEIGTGIGTAKTVVLQTRPWIQAEIRLRPSGCLRDQRKHCSKQI